MTATDTFPVFIGHQSSVSSIFGPTGGHNQEQCAANGHARTQAGNAVWACACFLSRRLMQSKVTKQDMHDMHVFATLKRGDRHGQLAATKPKKKKGGRCTLLYLPMVAAERMKDSEQHVGLQSRYAARDGRMHAFKRLWQTHDILRDQSSRKCAFPIHSTYMLHHAWQSHVLADGSTDTSHRSRSGALLHTGARCLLMASLLQAREPRDTHSFSKLSQH
eukprot:scaffold135860_cov21-Tisochrysis_lutea.AAC.1